MKREGGLKKDVKTKRRVGVVIGMCGSSLRNLSSECGTQSECVWICTGPEDLGRR